MYIINEWIQLIDLYDIDKNKSYEKYRANGKRGDLETFKRLIRRWRKDERVLQARNVGEELGQFIDINANPYQQYNAKKITLQINGEGELTQAWAKLEQRKEELDQYEEFLKNVEKITPKEFEFNKIENGRDYLEIGLFDMHFGVNDLDYYSNVLSKLNDVINQHNRKKIYFLIGQDLFHTDNFKGQTAKGTQLDTYLKEQDWEDALTFYTTLIDEAVKKAEVVEVIYTKGNHDESVSYGFVRELKAYYRYFKNILFDTEIEEYKARKVGNTMLVFTHSDKLKMNPETVLKMINRFKGIYIDCDYIEIHAGHLHHLITKEYAGSILRNQSSGAATDKWHKDNGFIGAQKMFQIYEYSEVGLDSIFNIRV